MAARGLQRIFRPGSKEEPPSQAKFEKMLMNSSTDWARRLTSATPEERAFLDQLSQKGEQADAGVMSEMDALRQRGDDLANVDEAYMQRAYQPAFERLMEGYQDMDARILEDMNRRGVMSGPQGGSEPESYQRMLLSRDTKNQMGRTMLEAQNQAVQQKLAQYTGRLAETNQANERFNQTQAPVIGAKVATASDRLNARTGAGTGMAQTRFGYAEGMHNINSQRQMASQDRMLSMIGAGIAGVGAGMQSLSDVNAKTDITEAESPEESLQDIDDLEVQKWRYKMGGGEHMGAMAQDMPQDMSPDSKSVDVPSYLGKLTQAVQALNARMGKYEMMLQGGA